jgi:calcineurin-like phosphoesterase
MGRVFMNATNDPFHAADDLLAGIKAKVILVDFHAEATSEKVAMGWHLDGRVTAVLGTHTHIPTADERVLPGGTAYQTDVGMSGPYDSIIGVEKDLVLHRFLTGMPGKFEAAKGNPKMCAALVTCDPKTGRATRHPAHHAWRVRKTVVSGRWSVVGDYSLFQNSLCVRARLQSLPSACRREPKGPPKNEPSFIDGCMNNARADAP